MGRKRLPLLGDINKSVTKNRVLLLLLLLSLFIGASMQLSVFGPHSAWGVDVEIVALGHDGTYYNGVDDFPTNAEVTLSGSRVVTVDYDGRVDTTNGIDTVNVGTGVFPYITSSVDGVMPRVSQAVGEVFYCNSKGEKTVAPEREFVNDTDNVGDVHYYFGFSVMFTTRAEVEYLGLVVLKNPTGGPDILTRNFAPVNPINLNTRVGFHVSSLTDTFQYKGVINNIRVVGEQARYTISSDISGVPDDIATFNNEYDWNSVNIKGVASGSEPILGYNVVDTDTENLATIDVGSTLRIGIDATNLGTFDDALDRLATDAGLMYSDSVNVYNVEYIYNFVVDVSINGVPISDYMANWASGTMDGTLPAKQPDFGVNWWLIGAIAAIALLGITVIRKILG